MVVILVAAAATVVVAAVVVVVEIARTLATPRSLLFHCVSSPACKVNRPSQALCWPLGSVGCSPSLSAGLRALRTCCPSSCIFYKLGHIQCTLSSLSCPHSSRHSSRLCVQVYAGELLTAVSKPQFSAQ